MFCSYRSTVAAGRTGRTVAEVTGRTIATGRTVAEATTTKAAAEVVTVALALVTILAGDDRRRLRLQFFDLHGEETQHVFVDAEATLDLVDHRAGGVDVQERVVRLAGFLDRVGQVAETPVLGLFDLALAFRDDLGDVFHQSVDLLRGNIGSRDDHVFVKCHFWSLLRGAAQPVRRADCPRWFPYGRDCPGTASLWKGA